MARICNNGTGQKFKDNYNTWIQWRIIVYICQGTFSALNYLMETSVRETTQETLFVCFSCQCGLSNKEKILRPANHFVSLE